MVYWFICPSKSLSAFSEAKRLLTKSNSYHRWAEVDGANISYNVSVCAKLWFNVSMSQSVVMSLDKSDNKVLYELFK